MLTLLEPDDMLRGVFAGEETVEGDIYDFLDLPRPASEQALIKEGEQTYTTRYGDTFVTVTDRDMHGKAKSYQLSISIFRVVHDGQTLIKQSLTSIGVPSKLKSLVTFTTGKVNTVAYITTAKTYVQDFSALSIAIYWDKARPIIIATENTTKGSTSTSVVTYNAELPDDNRQMYKLNNGSVIILPVLSATSQTQLYYFVTREDINNFNGFIIVNSKLYYTSAVLAVEVVKEEEYG